MPAMVYAVLLVALCGACANRPTLPRSTPAWVRDLPCPIVMYHRIGEPPPGSDPETRALYCSNERFRDHLAALTAVGRQTITLRELDEGLCGRRTLPERPIVLSFDDGTSDHWDASRQLRERGMNGVFFVVTGLLGRPGYLTRAEARTMHGDGMEIGSHSVSHRPLRELSWSEQAEEIAFSREDLEELLDAPVTSFAYPGGVFEHQTIQLVRRFGYRFARTTVSGVASTPVPNLRLQCVHAHESLTGYDLTRTIESDDAGPCPICGI